jgi:hypothetical protein
VEGRLASIYVDELARECRAVRSDLTLDLTNLRGIDATGVALLARLALQGVRLRNVSPYIRLRMQQPLSASQLAAV